MYNSPIEIFMKQIRMKQDDAVLQAVLQAVQDIGIEVNKDELIKALQYDRGQYDKGYADGQKDAKEAQNIDPESLRPQGEWISANNPPQKRGEYIVAIKYAEVSTTLVFDGTSWSDYSAAGQKIYYDVTHWMPLPAPPKEDA